MATETSRSIEVAELKLSDEQLASLAGQLGEELRAALESHHGRVEHLSKLRRAYKKRPETENKSYPWPGASNVVVPLVQITVDAIVARLMKAVLATQDIVEVEIKSQQWEPLEKDFRDWVKWFFTQAGIRSRLRTVFHDMALCGDAFVKPIWSSKERTVHFYDAQGNVASQQITDYVGPTWDVPSADDIVVPVGFDEWDQLPWWAQCLRYTWAELKQNEQEQQFKGLDRLRGADKERDDKRGQDAKEAMHLQGKSARVFDVYEIWGLFEVPKQVPEGQEPTDETEFQELIVLFHLETETIIRCIYNPFFGKARYMMKIPYLVQAHELYAIGAGEQVYPNQLVTSTVHNQVIDAATAANAGILVASPDTNLGEKEEIYPGKVIRDPSPDKVRILHLSSPEPALSHIEEKQVRYSETSSGVSSYNLGMESTIIGSRATATGTTALINEGNIRFWVSIDDMRDALVECLYLTISLIQQYQPEGVQISPEKTIVFPPGDVRTSMGLNFKLTSETLNKDLELQNLQVLMGMLNQYYSQLMNACAMIFNPQFPPEHKAAAMAVLNSAHDVMKRFVERFQVENVDTIVPDLITIIQQSMQAANAAQPGQLPAGPGMGQAPGLGAPPALAAPGGGIGPGA